MDKIVVKGGNRLVGEVQVSGAKNAALPIVAATLLADGEHTLHNVPDLADLKTMLAVLRTMGCEAERQAGRKRSTVIVEVKPGVVPEAPYDLVRTMRASVLVLGPAPRAARPGPGQPARRLCHRQPPHRPAPQGPGGAGREDHARPRATWRPGPSASSAPTSTSTW